MHIAPDVVAEHAGQAQHKQKNAVYDGGFRPAPAEGVHADGNDVFKHRKHRGQACEDHEQEEQRTPETAAGHVDEHVRQGLEYQGRAVVGLDAEGEAGGEDDRACHERDEGVQRADAHGLARQGLILRHVAAEDLHRGDAEAQREEGLVHGGGDYRAEADLAYRIYRGQQIEFHAIGGAGQSETVYREHHDERQQCEHHDLAHAFKTLLQAERADQRADNHDKLRPYHHLAGI